MGVLDSIGRLERRVGTDRAGAYAAISGEPTTPHLLDAWSSLDDETRDWVQRAALFGWLAEDALLAALIVDLSPRTLAYWDSTQVKQLGALPMLAPILFGIVSLVAAGPALWVVLVGVTIMVAIGLVALRWSRGFNQRQKAKLRKAILANQAVADGHTARTE